MQCARKLALATGIYVTALFAAHPALATDEDRFNIVGLKLGMSPEQAMQILRAHGVKESTIDETRQSYSYSDGIKHDYRTEDFLFRVAAMKDEITNNRRSSDTFNLYFSPPPEGGQLVAVQRTIENRIDPVTNGQFRQAVIGKYGEPTDSTPGNLNWKFGSGTKNCVSGSVNGIGISVPTPRPGRSESILGIVYRKSGSQVQLNQFKNSRINSLEECASMLEYSIMNMDDRPATTVRASMIDVQSWVKAELAASEQVETLRRAAIEKRESKGSKPAL